VLHKITSTMGVGVSVPGHQPQDHVDSLSQLSYPSSPPKDWDSTLTGLNQLHKRLYLLFLSKYGVYVHNIDICCVLQGNK
jgi:hypothetical protein